MQHLQ